MEKIIRCNRVNCIKCGKMLCINNIPLLSSLTDEEARLISQGVSSDAYKKGDVIFAQGQKANKLYIICSGKMKIFKNSLDGKEQILYILSAGDFIGAFNLLKEDEFDFNAVAIEDTQISTLEKAEFDKIVITNPQITLKIFEKAYERIIKAEALVERLSSKSPDAKIAGLLIDLVEDFGHKTEKGILLELSISREEMGSYAGITRETMSRKLQLFQELGLIQLEGVKKILIYDVNKLKTMI
ncbi:Crp/Fnr family transcriptional regulator [Fusibacter sp. 3D3]|uniref:Crp/Fnr family transcriptional regulator n=1 Tax=Fusibacter sp. 3D3 TaxID=1048380 RepID=UPI000852A391|nr:Crp/Fnr family transcriptional regulator [Fusibacter sp. 3D3]